MQTSSQYKWVCNGSFMLVYVKKMGVPEAAQKPAPEIFGKNCPFSLM